MLDFPLWKRIWLWAVTLFFALSAVPSLIALTGASWPSALPSPMVNLGLDLAGGSHILLEADPAATRCAPLSRASASATFRPPTTACRSCSRIRARSTPRATRSSR